MTLWCRKWCLILLFPSKTIIPLRLARTMWAGIDIFFKTRISRAVGIISVLTQTFNRNYGTKRCRHWSDFKHIFFKGFWFSILGKGPEHISTMDKALTFCFKWASTFMYTTIKDFFTMKGCVGICIRVIILHVKPKFFFLTQ